MGLVWDQHFKVQINVFMFWRIFKKIFFFLLEQILPTIRKIGKTKFMHGARGLDSVETDWIPQWRANVLPDEEKTEKTKKKTENPKSFSEDQICLKHRTRSKGQCYGAGDEGATRKIKSLCCLKNGNTKHLEPELKGIKIYIFKWLEFCIKTAAII